LIVERFVTQILEYERAKAHSGWCARAGRERGVVERLDGGAVPGAKGDVAGGFIAPAPAIQKSGLPASPKPAAGPALATSITSP
jgi:hypothetical protein